MHTISCIRCGDTFDYKSKHKIYCAACTIERRKLSSRMYYQKNRKRVLARNKEWYRKNRPLKQRRNHEYFVKHRQSNPEWIEENKRRAKIWRAKNKKHIKRYDKLRRAS